VEIVELTGGRGRRVRFNGVIYRRYPHARDASSRNYYRCGVADALRGFGSLHRDVWVYHFGAIPPGHDVHHRDGNFDDNRPENLECLPAAEHQARHADESARRARQLHQDRPELFRRMLDAAARWHGSEEGRAWHAEHGRRSWEGRAPSEHACGRCGTAYHSRKPSGNRFCSPRCRAAARRESGADDVRRACACGGSFVANRYSKQRFCSRACGQRHRRQGGGPG
jgi:hypothetical protein